MTAYLIHTFLLLSSISLTYANLFANPSFEDTFGQDNWSANGASLDRNSDSFDGSYSGKIINRRGSWAGVSQYVPAERGKAYQFTIMIKLLNQRQDFLWHKVSLTLGTQYEDTFVYHYVGQSPYNTVGKGWIRIGGDIRMRSENIESARFYLQIPEADINYLVDSAEMIEIPDVPTNWVEQANDRIDRLRKNDITLNFQISESYDPEKIQIKVILMKHDFPFGSAVRARRFNGNSDVEQEYRNFFFNTFGWAVLENSLKWKLMEKKEGDIDYERPDKTIEMLREQNVPIRGHCVLWGVETNTPEWLRNKTGNEIEAQVERRIKYLIPYYRNKIAHWDVTNEQIHGDWFEQKTEEPKFLAQTFHKVRAEDSLVKLFLNDFQLVNEGWLTHAYIYSALELVSQGVPLYGLGAQSHISGVPDLARISNRLELLAEAGLPVWITELDIDIQDISTRAQAYDDIIRLYFSHPDVEGILLWGFWEGAHSKPGASLVDGTDTFDVNDAGRRVVSLLREEWWTSGEFFPREKEETFILRGFQGEYEVEVTYDGEIITKRQFYLHKGLDISVTIAL